jgi:hypothetical protein
MNEALSVLKRGVDSMVPWLQEDGELFDPIFHEPTQYGTPYYAFCNAVLARILSPEEHADLYRERAVRGLRASLAYVLHPELPPRMSSANRETGEAWGINHRDFFWPAILKTYQLLKATHSQLVADLTESIAAVRVEQSFAERPPNNWACVWLSGEWQRYFVGLSPYTREQIDSWIGAYFATHILMEQGFYMEPGLPNSYDLFTRYHLADILLSGYDGPWANELERLMETGLRRSLAVQLSDGSLASAHRSSGQTWTLGVQCAYFRMAAGFFEDRDPALAKRAEQAAGRALSALRRFQRPDGPFSPAENLLPSGYRVGYELYASDGHYSSLTLAFLAAAVLRGLADICPEDLAPRAPEVLVEHDPTFRAIAHRGPYSLHFNAAPAEDYDAFGIVDVTFGPGRFLQFASSVRYLGSERFYNLGIAHRKHAGRASLLIPAHMDHDLVTPIERGAGEAGFNVHTRPKGSPFAYRLAASIEGDGIHIEETLVGMNGYKTLLIPYLRDPGMGLTTRVELTANGLNLSLGEEKVAFTFSSPVEHVLNLPHGYENRRGLCGLLRVDFRDPSESVAYRIAIVH